MTTARHVFFVLLLGIGLLCSGRAESDTPPLFWSGFESGTTVATPGNCWSTGCWQDISGTDSSTTSCGTGSTPPCATWLPTLPGWGTIVGGFFLLADNPSGTMTPTTIGNYMFDQILTRQGHKGSDSNVLYSQVTQSGCCGGDRQTGVAQNNLMLMPNTEPSGTAGDLYLSYWVMYQPDLDKQLTSGSSNSRVLFEFKTGSAYGNNDGDYRFIVEVATWGCTGSPAPPFCWLMQTDNNASGNPLPVVYWTVNNSSVPVPVGQWFKFEVFWHRSTGSDGRIWAAVNGNMILNQYGQNKYVYNINRIYVFSNYGTGAYPLYLWLDDLQIWNGFPVVSVNDPWYDTPYASH